MKFPTLWTGSLLCLFSAPPALPADDTLQEIVVTATLRATSAADLPQSVTVLDRDTLRAAGVQHFEDVLGLIPDLNWAAGTSRPRFFQLRGIGEVEQYQGAPNPSVGFLIDDIDFSGVGMPATLVRHPADRSSARAARHGVRGQRVGRVDQRAHGGSRHRVRTRRAKSPAPITIRAPRALPSATASPEAAPAGAWLRNST